MTNKLPPGQHAVHGFPRFGTHLHHPPPRVPDDPAIVITGAVREPFALPLGDLTTLPRRRLTADFHCAAGWTATDLEWEGVDFANFYGMSIEPALQPGATVTHLGFVGLDGFRSIVTIEDALSGDVLIADRLHGRPLDPDHGAPVRLVSPRQYGYKSTKHLCRIEVHTSAPEPTFAHLDPLSRVVLRSPLIGAHPRARVAEEERHPYMPGTVLRPVYTVLRPVFRYLSGRASRRSGDAGD